MKKAVVIVCAALIIAASFISSLAYTSKLAYIPPQSERKSIESLALKSISEFTDADFELAYEQTGLGRAAVMSLESTAELVDFQERYYSDVEFVSIKSSPISREDRVRTPSLKLAGIEKGDVLITHSPHILSWRNGHAAIVVDAENGKTLEAVVIGQISSEQSISKWETYSNVLVLRLKNTSAAERGAIADAARENLSGKSYNAAVGLFPQKYCELENAGATQCAHLVWLSFAAYGYDTDGNGGLIVTPADIAQSSLFEIVQRYGR